MPDVSSHRSPQLLSAARSRLLIVDMQEKLLPVIPDADALTAACVRLVQGAAILGVPVSCTEQYPKGLGPTVPALASPGAQPAPRNRIMRPSVPLCGNANAGAQLVGAVVVKWYGSWFGPDGSYESGTQTSGH